MLGTVTLGTRFGARTRATGTRRCAPAARDPLAWARGVWWSVAVVGNAMFAAAALAGGGLGRLAVEAALLDFVIAVAARHDRVVRAAFVLGRLVPSYGLHQLTYHLGQLHRAMAIAGTAWFTVALGAAATAVAAVGCVVLLLLAAMMWTARDARRHGRHEAFERVHRYGGWTALALLTGLVVHDGQPVAVLLLAVLVALVAHPWLGVRRVACEVLAVTDQLVVLALPGRRSRGEFVRVSREGREWHAFAVATTGEEGDGRYCLVIRRAGDWTERLARDAAAGRPPGDLLVRRMRGTGFMYHAQACRRALVVATGAGIGPVLPYLLGPRGTELECLWIARDHRAAVGGELVDRVLAGGGVTLLDSASGRPDVGALVAAHAPRFDAVFVVGNAKVRDAVAHACERVCVPWYGPTFDS